jgi:high-affinity Fe2+/Pb2+ permease
LGGFTTCGSFIFIGQNEYYISSNFDKIKSMKRILAFIFTCIFFLVAIFTTTSPNDLPSFLLLVPFILTFIAMFLFWYGLFTAYRQEKGRAIRMSLLLGGLPALLLVLQSIGQLTARDVIGVGVLLILSYTYLSKFSISAMRG